MSSRFTPLEQIMDQIVRQRRSESAWREIVARQEQSGLTVQDFCEREDLKAANLYSWRVRLRREPVGKTVPRGFPEEHMPRRPRVSSSICGRLIRAAAVFFSCCRADSTAIEAAPRR